MLANRFYYLHPLLAGSLDAWSVQLDRIAAMGFDAVVIAPPFATGRSHDLFLTADAARLDPRLGAGDAIEALARLAASCRERHLRLMLDLVVDRVAAEQAGNGLAASYRTDPSDELPDPRESAQDPGVARIVPGADIAHLIPAWASRLTECAEAGIAGFRCLRPHGVPALLWRKLFAAVRSRHPDLCFMAAESDEADGLAEAGFDLVGSSLRGWDYHADWFADAADRLARVASLVAMPEAPFDRRLGRGFADGGRAKRAAHRALALTTAFGAAWMMPMGFEFGAARRMDPARDRPEDFARLVAEAPFDLSDEVAAANARRGAEPARITALRQLSPADAPAAALLLADDVDADRPRVVVVNASLDEPVRVPLAPLLAASGVGAALLDDEADHDPLGPDSTITIAPADVRILRAAVAAPIGRPVQGAAEAAAAARIAIEAVAPAVEAGRFPAKRLVGDTVEVSADLIADGHDRLAAVLLWRPADEAQWREAPMTPLGNDRWTGHFPLSRLGPHLFTVLAWKDSFASFAEELEKKHAAGLPIELELAEGKRLVEEYAAIADPAAAPGLRALARQLGDAGPQERRRLLLAPATAELIAASRVRPHAYRHPTEFPVEAERRAAGFASWYELFPRSQSGDPHRHGTFADVIARLPAIAGMGFDVLYFPPIHPIGRVNRKGRDNSPQAEPGDPGSPYAIGSVEGGHDAIHSSLGTLDDFRRLRDEAARHRIELALDFAVQCAPDHPWLKAHPDWFVWRPDGSIRYAENPPKKYEDIVNVDFYAEGAVPSLWKALLDVVLFWAGEGVRLFRVDNPHTKPLPFWEWLIARVRGEYPDAVFLAEAFTRPKLMYRLAKIGFSQSYTYFTWRNTKSELTEYLTELTTADAREFFRPHFFVNTPDINPAFLQTSGRPGFLIRAALAATLSGLFGAYSGFRIVRGAGVAGARGIRGVGEIRNPCLGLERARQHCRGDHPAQPDPPREPGAPDASRRQFPQRLQRPDSLFR